MASPIDVGTSPVRVAARNVNRRTIFFQNTGEGTLYFKKQIPGASVNVPSATNYDFILEPTNIKDDKAPPAKMSYFELPFGVDTTASFYAVCSGNNGKVAVMETNYTGVC